MKKRLVLMVTTIVALAMLTACGNNNNAAIVNGNEETSEEVTEEVVEVEEDIDPTEYVTLPDYSEIAVSVEAKQEVTDEVIDEKVDAVLQRNSYYELITDRVAEDGDLVEITYVGTVDGEEFDSGTIGADGSDFILGSGSTIDGFEEAIVGMSVGEQKIAPMTFPEDYAATDLAGQDAEFDITLVAIKELVYPEVLTEEMITAAEPDCTTEEELREKFRLEMEEVYATQFDENVRYGAFDVVFEQATFAEELPQSMMEEYEIMLYDQIEQYAMLYGMDMTSVIETFYGMTLEEFDVVVVEQAALYTQSDLLLQAIALEEGIEASEEEVNALAEEEYAAAGYETVEDFIEIAGYDQIVSVIKQEKILDLFVENAIVEEIVAEEVVAE